MTGSISLRILQALFVVWQASAAGSHPPPGEVLRSALKALGAVESVGYEVRREYVAQAEGKIAGRTTVVATRAPFRFRASFRSDDGATRDMAVSDGAGMRVSAGGKIDESPAVFATGYANERPMRVMNEATRDVAGTWRMLLDRAFLEEMASSRNLLYVKQEEIDGELCHVVLVVRESELYETVSTYYWVSASIGLPLAVQNVTLTRGRTSVTPRFVLSRIQLNPPAEPALFSYQPLAADSTSPAPTGSRPKATARDTTAVGRILPALEVRDVHFKALNLADFKGRALVVNFWAPWCGPCVNEFPALQRLQTRYQSDLRILAVAVQDARLNVLRFIEANPRYRFTFLTDPKMPDNESPLATFFGVDVIPVSVFVNRQGRIVDRWIGFESDEALTKRIERLMRLAAGAAK